MQKSKTLYIDKEAVATLSMAKLGILAPVKGLMNSSEAKKVDESSLFNGQSFPFSFILAPSGRRNKEVLEGAKKGERLTLVCDGKECGGLTVDEVFEIDPIKRVQNIYKTTDMSHPGIQKTLKRLGNLAVSGDYDVDFMDVSEAIGSVQAKIKNLEAKSITGMVMAARPLHRAHERMIRQALEKCDLMVIFLSKPYLHDLINYDLRRATVDYFVKNFLPSEKIVVVPLENTYIFAGNNEVILNAIAVKNFGCTKFIVGQNHAGLGMHYEKKKISTIFDQLVGIDLDIETVSEFVYCNECKTLVTTNTCPHGQHHHISYHSDSILELFKVGILPPAVLIRKEISAMILAKLHPNRFKNIPKLYYDFIPGSGLIEEHSEEDFYLSLMRLYQTSSLT